MTPYRDYIVKLKSEVIENYSVEEKIWQGATSTVYKCINKYGKGKHGSIVAIKVLHPYRKDPLQIKMFIREGRIQQKLSHENIVRTFSVGKTEDFYFILMEYIRGSNLKVFSQNGIPPFRQLLEMFRDLAYTLSYMHGRKILHNDIKPENIMFDQAAKSLKLTDFGYASTFQKWFNRKFPAGGTEKYMAPERKTGISDTRSDIYSFGMVLDEFLPQNERDEIISSIIHKAIQREPHKRYASFSEMISDMKYYFYNKP